MISEQHERIFDLAMDLYAGMVLDSLSAQPDSLTNQDALRKLSRRCLFLAEVFVNTAYADMTYEVGDGAEEGDK